MYDDDYIGELIGELVDEVGARRGKRRRKKRRAKRKGTSPAKPKTVGNKLMASSQRQRIMGFGSVQVPAGAMATLDAVVQKPIQIQRLIVSASAVGLVITDIRVGVASQFTSVEGVPAETFAADSVGVGIEFDPAPTGITVSVTFNNPTANPIDVSASAIGVSAD